MCLAHDGRIDSSMVDGHRQRDAQSRLFLGTRTMHPHTQAGSEVLVLWNLNVFMNICLDRGEGNFFLLILSCAMPSYLHS